MLLRGVGTLRYYFPPNASVQWQPDGLTIHTKKWFLGAGFLGSPPISLTLRRGFKTAASQVCECDMTAVVKSSRLDSGTAGTDACRCRVREWVRDAWVTASLNELARMSVTVLAMVCATLLSTSDALDL